MTRKVLLERCDLERFFRTQVFQWGEKENRPRDAIIPLCLSERAVFVWYKKGLWLSRLFTLLVNV